MFDRRLFDGADAFVVVSFPGGRLRGIEYSREWAAAVRLTCLGR